jgi:hypothetical protein
MSSALSAASAGAVTLVLVCLGGPAWADTSVHARLHPQNDSGAGGTATLTATDNGDLRVRIHARGLLPGPHAQHVHGSLEGGRHMCATMADDRNGDGVLTNEEGTGEYGSIFLSLTTSGDTSATSGLALDRMPVADANGKLRYHRTIPAAALPEGLVESLSQLHVVQHGIDDNDNGRYDLAALGESTFARKLGLPQVPEEATNPATCGVVTGAGSPHPPHGGIETGGGDATAAEGHSTSRAAIVGWFGTLAVVVGAAWQRARLRRSSGGRRRPA